MLKRILSISGKPGLFSLVSQGRNMLIVESLENKKRMPAYARDKVMSLGDIAMYTYEEDVPLADVLEMVKSKTGGEPVNLKDFADSKALRDFFGTILENFDRERVHDSDIRKLFQWYNILLAAGIKEFKDQPAAEEQPEDNNEEKGKEEK